MNIQRFPNVRIVLLVGILCLLGPIAAAQQTEEPSRLQSLRGIKAVRVQVVDFATDFKAEFNKAGLTEGLLETMVERRLEDAGIKVLQEFEPDLPNQTGLLRITLQAHSPMSARKFTMTGEGIEFSAPGGQPPYLYLIKVDFRQPVILARDASFGLTTLTWSADTFGIRRLSRLTPMVNQQVEGFIQAFRSVNP
jgi:hypothetical protein